jgi:hypothetical protein
LRLRGTPTSLPAVASAQRFTASFTFDWMAAIVAAFVAAQSTGEPVMSATSQRRPALDHIARVAADRLERILGMDRRTGVRRSCSDVLLLRVSTPLR